MRCCLACSSAEGTSFKRPRSSQAEPLMHQSYAVRRLYILNHINNSCNNNMHIASGEPRGNHRSGVLSASEGGVSNLSLAMMATLDISGHVTQFQETTSPSCKQLSHTLKSAHRVSTTFRSYPVWAAGLAESNMLSSQVSDTVIGLEHG